MTISIEQSRPSRRATSGFTLMEMMVALAAASLLMAALLTSYSMGPPADLAPRAITPTWNGTPE